MEDYPEAFLEHNVPLIVVSGLSNAEPRLDLPGGLAEEGILLRSAVPSLQTKESEVLKAYFDEIDTYGKSWTGYDREQLYRFRVQVAGRSFLLPPRRARLPESSEPLEPTAVLHSPFSPLSSNSSLYPDGLIDAQWVKKHQDLIPSIYVCFYSLSSDPTSATLQDNRTKSDINETKAALAKSGYKTRIAVILLGDGDPWNSSMQESMAERVDIIRRGTALDPKSVFAVSPQESPGDLKEVLDNILSILFGHAVEYYRDLGRHAKKKRSRGIAPQPTVPPTSGTSQTLSLPDWNVRYDFKSGIFAEFRQEVDAALRSFEQAYEILLGPDVLDSIPNWSPRWNQARMLADVISIRCLRLHLWLGHTSLAVRRWQVHRDRIGDFVDRRGMGTNTYGWQAWEARWAMVMAKMIEMVEIPELSLATTTLYLPPEKAVIGERLQPWELLHHTGYWYRIAARHLSLRRTLATMMSDEDRTPPDSSPASTSRRQGLRQDTYLCVEPHEEFPLVGRGVNHSQMIIDCLILAQSQYQSRKQLRVAAELSLECAREMIRTDSWDDALSLLRPLWENRTFRSENWLDVSEELCWLLRRAAVASARADLVVTIDWELLHKKFTKRPHWHYDLNKSLDGLPTSEKVAVTLNDEDDSSFIDASFAFYNKESKAGESCMAQLCLTSNAMPGSAPVSFESIVANFSGSLKPIILRHAPADAAESRVHKTHIALKEAFLEGEDEDLPSELTGESDLTLRPGQTRVLELTIPLREAGEVEATSLLLHSQQDAFTLEYRMQLGSEGTAKGWFIGGSTRPRKVRQDVHQLHVLPKPPKMEIRLLDSPDQYYANEHLDLKIELLNAENETAQVKLDLHLFGKEVPGFSVESGAATKSVQGAEEEARLVALSIGRIDSQASHEIRLCIDPAAAPTAYELHLRALYHLDSDPATPVIQTLQLQLNVVNAFEANYDLVPRIHAEPWPSLFDAEGLQDVGEATDSVPARGIAQKWCLVCHYASFANEDTRIVGLDTTILSSIGSSRCDVINGPEIPSEGLIMSPKTMHEARFELVVQKQTLEDKQPVSLDLGFLIKWQRAASASSTVNTTLMPVGKYVVLGTEPRVLASVVHSPFSSTGLMHLDLTIENGSNHFLTFGLSMEPSDEFAFSGAKQTTVHLLPLSRRTVTYRLLPLVGDKFIRPGLVVRDKYFQKVLRIIPTEGMKIDKEGLLVWVPGLSAAAEENEEGEDPEQDP